MPTAAGLPRAGEVWRRDNGYPHNGHNTVFKVLSRGRGDYWSMRVQILAVDGKPPQRQGVEKIWVDCAYWFSKGELSYLPDGQPTSTDDYQKPDHHEERLRAAEAFAQWHLGDRNWAGLILDAYMHPKASMERLKLEKAS